MKKFITIGFSALSAALAFGQEEISSAVRDQIEARLAKMSVREKIGQCVNIQLSRIPLQSDAETAAWFAKYPIGSVFMGRDLANVYDGVPDNKTALTRCARATKIPLTVSGDLGPVTSPLALPSNGALGALDDRAVAREFGRIVGRAGRANGFHWVFAPCVDLAYNWLNPIMGCRTMGDDAEKVMALSEEIVLGMQEFGLSACVKHYPGDGVDHRDQHLGPSVNSFSHEHWNQTYGRLYRRLFEKGCHSVMIGHISLPFADPPKGAYALPPPAVMSAPITTGILRGEQNFKGVVVTDALMMGGFLIYRFENEAQRFVEAFKAGADVLLWPNLETFDLMEEEVKRGTISLARLDASVRRILEMKAKEGLFETPFVAPAGVSEDMKNEAAAFTRKVLEREVMLVRNDEGLLPLDQKTVKKVLLWIADGSGRKTAESYDVLKRGFEKRGAAVTIALNGNCLDLWKREKAGERYDAVFFLFNSGMHMIKNAIRPVGPAGECLWTMSATDFHRPIALTFSYPYLLQDAPWLTTLVNVHSGPNSVVQDSVVALLYGERPFQGKSPFDLSVDFGVKD